MWLRPSDGPEQMALLLERDPDLHLAARDGSGRLVGAVLGGWDGRRAYVYHLVVAPDRQRQGIAGRLMDELEERFRARGALKAKLQILVGNEVSRAFFAARGYLFEADPSRGARSSSRAARRRLAAAERRPPGTAAGGHPAGCCCVMQCTLPPPISISRPGTVDDLAVGEQRLDGRHGAVVVGVAAASAPRRHRW